MYSREDDIHVLHASLDPTGQDPSSYIIMFSGKPTDKKLSV